jgi:hypothetical protein
LNSYMDLCVKLQIPELAIHVYSMLRDYEITHDLPTKFNPQELCEQVVETPGATLDETKITDEQLQ